MKWCAEVGMAHSELLAWDPADRSKLMALLIEDAARCQLCGTADWEWDEDPYVYEAMPKTCRGCATKEFSQELAGDSPGTRITLVPKATAQAIRRNPPKSSPKIRRQ
jgi:hypothetical protein